MTPLERYQYHCQQSGFAADPAQQAVVDLMQSIYLGLTEKRPNHTPLSLYLWGRVGRGKSFLMDMLYHCIAGDGKQRVHFYRFMRDVHRQLAKIQGVSDPLIHIADALAQRVRVLCFDEFFVTDIGDAMLLGRLLQRLFEQGVVVIVTSNVAPDKLYENGLQRQRFLPAIAAIKANMQVVHLDGQVDHRMRRLRRSDTYFIANTSAMYQLFCRHGIGAVEQGGSITIEHRDIPFVYRCEGAIWFDFAQLCGGPRSQNDYIALARRFAAIYVDGVPQLGGQLSQRRIAQGTEDSLSAEQLMELNRQRDQALQSQSTSDDETRRLIALVDELYDRKIALYLNAAVAITELYQGGRLAMAFERTISRVIEMQSVEYLAQTGTLTVGA